MLALSMFSDDDSDQDTENGAPTKPSETTTSIISNGAEIEGVLRFSSVDLRIEGTVHGDITTDGRVVVSEGAEVEGTIHANTIKLSGTVEGHIRAEEELVLGPPSEVHATLEADVLEIQPGADFSGEVPEEHSTIHDVWERENEDDDAEELIPIPSPSENGNGEVAEVPA